MLMVQQSTINPVVQELIEKTYKELGYDPKTNTFSPPVPSRKPPVKLPFRIPAIEKTQRQWTRDTGYKASAAWQTASLLRDLILLWTQDYLSIFLSRTPSISSRKTPVNFGTIRRLQTQIEDAGRSMVSTFEEGWGRPSTKEFLDFIGFAQASLVEIRGDIERSLVDGLIKSEREITGAYGNLRDKENDPMARTGIPTPSRTFPYPPVSSRSNPSEYGKLRERLRGFTGREMKGDDLSYELFIELCNKTSFLFRRAVEGLWNKLSKDEQEKLKNQLNSLWGRW